jgi:adenosylcobinamide-phosphate synthase
VLYRACARLHDDWGRAEVLELTRFGWFARRAFEVLDWVPARLTATGFAIVGDFEDAVYAWRSQANTWINSSVGTVMASGAGAMGVRLGNPLRLEDGTYEERPELGLGEEPDVPYLDSTVGLIWRALVLWLALIFIVSVVRWLA